MPNDQCHAPHRMRRSLAAALLVVNAAAASQACTSLVRRARQQPAALAGLWLDVDRSTRGDTAFWRLAPDGTFRPFHRRISPAGRTASNERFAPQHGYWYLHGPLADPSARVLCVHNSRIAAYCVGFSLDTTADGTRRLRLRAYRGAFSVSARTLVERL